MRDVPMSQKLRSILDMRRHAPDGKEHAANTYVFGNEVGERVALEPDLALRPVAGIQNYPRPW